MNTGKVTHALLVVLQQYWLFIYVAIFFLAYLKPWFTFPFILMLWIGQAVSSCQCCRGMAASNDRCAFCEKAVCHDCVRPCQACDGKYCQFCSVMK